jgi:hypothetical protein
MKIIHNVGEIPDNLWKKPQKGWDSCKLISVLTHSQIKPFFNKNIFKNSNWKNTPFMAAVP